MIVLPALSTAYVGLAAIWHWPLANEVAKSCSVICVLLGARCPVMARHGASWRMGTKLY